MRNFLIKWAAYGYGLGTGARKLGLAFLTGLCCVTAAAAQDPLKIVALGDSLTAGYGLAEGEGLVPQLQAWLDARGHSVKIENAGVSGDTSAGGLSRLDWALGDGADGLMVILGGNDMLRGIPPAEVRANVEAILQGAASRELPVLLVGMKAPLNWGPDYKAAFDAAYPELAASYGALYLDDFFAGFAGANADPSDPAAMAAYMQGDAIHPSAPGVALVVEALGPKVEELIAKAAQN